MTLHECEIAARSRMPVTYDGVVYKRITEISRVYASEEQKTRGMDDTVTRICLEDRTGRSCVYTDRYAVVEPAEEIGKIIIRMAKENEA